jgi:hypothetical protein
VSDDAELEHVLGPNGHCKRCGQTPSDGDAFTDMLFGRTTHCLTDTQLLDMEIYYRQIVPRSGK